jgi:peptidyl-prolyl cis-trans isomerase SurA
MNSKQIWAGVLALAALGAPLPAAHAQMAEAVAAIVNDDVISTYDVRQRANLLLISAGVQSTPELQERARMQALRELVDEQLQLQETAHFEITISDAEVDRRVGDIARSNNATIEQFQATLAQSGISLSTLRAQIRADIAWNRLMGGLYGTRLRISPLEVRETQERIAANSTRPQFLISEIFLPAETPAEFTEVEAGAMRLLQEMQRGAPFPLVARQFSASTSAANGGDLGWVASGEMTVEVQAVVERLQPGQVSLPVRTPTGIYIIALRERREGQPAGASTQISLRQITAPAARRAGLERIQRRLNNCSEIDREVATVEGAAAVDLGATAEIDLSEAIRTRIAEVDSGHATSVEVVGDQASILVVCGRETSGGGVPSREEIENRLYEQELALLSERYLRNLRREATIITR